MLGATNIDVPPYKIAFLAILRRLHGQGVVELNGHLLYGITDQEYADADAWLQRTGMWRTVDELAATYRAKPGTNLDSLMEKVTGRMTEIWQGEAGVKTYAQAVADVMEFRSNEGEEFPLSTEQWMEFANTASFYSAKAKAKSMGIHIIWDCERPRSAEGYYQVQGGIEYAIAKSLAAAPFADLLWMETKTADLKDAREFAEAIHAKFPDKMLAYNLSPSFNWDTTGMTEEQMRAFPEELGKLGFVFNFITYGGHQIDGLASEEFALALRQDGMLALARLQRKLRLVESPYATPQTLVGGPRLDGALGACSGRTASTAAMGKGSTQFQHLVQTEVPTSLLVDWLAQWNKHYGHTQPLRVKLRPNRSGSDLLELQVLGPDDNKLANVIFATIQDRRGRTILSVRDQNTFELPMRQKRLMTLLHLFLIHRYKAVAVHYVTPTEDNQYQTAKMKSHGIYSQVNNEVGEIIVADVDSAGVARLLEADGQALQN